MFVVEGKKLTQEIVKSNFEIEVIYSTENQGFKNSILVSPEEMKKISALKNPTSILALVKIPLSIPIQYHQNTLVLNDIQDPGNLGTIIRTADWFGITQIICSCETVDVYNPKVIQATMGSISRVALHYLNIESFLNEFKGKIYAADMDGASIYQEKVMTPFALIMGNEGHGIPHSLLSKAHIISIPNKSKNQAAESLNVSVATAVILSEWLQ